MATFASLNGEGQSNGGSEATATPLINTRGVTERIVVGNSTEAQALMINGAVGEDLWKDIDRLEIRGNNAGVSSTMVNHAISFEVLKWMMQYQGKREREMERATAALLQSEPNMAIPQEVEGLSPMLLDGTSDVQLCQTSPRPSGQVSERLVV
jgi:hypothetical protein